MNVLEEAVRIKCLNCLTCYKEYKGNERECPYFDDFTTRQHMDELIMNCEHFEPMIEALEKPQLQDEILNAVKDYNDYPFEQFTDLWNRIIAFLKKHVDFNDPKDYHVCTAWVFANWIPEKWEIFPYLYFYGIHESGKNQAWQTLSKISYNNVESANIRAAPLFRRIRPKKISEHDVLVKLKNGGCMVKTIKEVTGELDYSTLFLDELGILLGKSSEDEQDIHMILDAGYKKDGKVTRCVGKDNEPTDFLVGGFKSIASVYKIPDALRSRCILMKMVRSERRFPIRWDEREIEQIRDNLKLWRFHALQNLQMSLEYDEFIEYQLFDYCDNGRLVQLFYCLYRVAPLSIKPLILEVLKEEGSQKIQTALASFESGIFNAVLQVYDKDPDAYLLLTTDILYSYNADPDNTPIKLNTLHNAVEALGFKPQRTAKKKGFINHKALIDKLKVRFQLGGQQTLDTLPSPPESAQVAQSALSNSGKAFVPQSAKAYQPTEEHIKELEAKAEEIGERQKGIPVLTLEELMAQRAKESKDKSNS